MIRACSCGPMLVTSFEQYRSLDSTLLTETGVCPGSERIQNTDSR
jgi:hypothetical protein